MSRLIRVMAGLTMILVLACAATVQADQKEDAVAMVKAAAAYLKEHGTDKTLEALNDPKGNFVKGTLYVFAYDSKGTLVANSLKMGLVGQNLLDLPDSKGKKFRREIVERANKGETGWVDYVSQHPQSGDLEEKTTYFQKEGSLILACGIYKK